MPLIIYLCRRRKNEYSGHLAMPVLEKIVISDFRNIEFQELFFSPNVNCISGNNGEGKTNLLDAVYYLSMTKSSYASSDRYNFRYGTAEFSIGGTYRMQNGTEFAIRNLFYGGIPNVSEGPNRVFLEVTLENVNKISFELSGMTLPLFTTATYCMNDLAIGLTQEAIKCFYLNYGIL